MSSIFKSKYTVIGGTSHNEVMKSARNEYQIIQHKTKRQPYVRSVYFNKDKIFLNIFFNHLVQKRRSEQTRRASLFICATDLLRHNTTEPQTILSKDYTREILHRFIGETKDGRLFYVQVKQNKKTGRKDFMSVFFASNSQK